MKYFTIIPAFLALAIGTFAAPAPDAESLVVKRDVSSELQSLYSEVKQYRASIDSATSSMTASSTAAQNATAKATIAQQTTAMTLAIRQTTAAVMAAPSDSGSQLGQAIGALLAEIVQAVFEGGELLGSDQVLNAVFGLVFGLLQGPLQPGLAAVQTLLQTLLSALNGAVPS